MSGGTHIARAEHHYTAFESFRDSFPDWACVALFYSALHYVDAALSSDRSVPANCRKPAAHNLPEGNGRTQIVNQYYRDIADQYRTLEALSRIARYYTASDELGRLAALFAQLPPMHAAVKNFCVARRQF